LFKNALHSSDLDPIKEDEMGGACSTHGEMRNAFKILVGKPGRKRPSEDKGVDGRIIL
jgi:hypothetical protein